MSDKITIPPISAGGAGNQSGFFNKYPYTDFHELNLDWLLTNYKNIIDEINQIVDWVNNHQISYEDAIKRLTIVENEIATFEEQITAAFEDLKTDLQRQFEEQKEDLQRALEETQAEVDRTITQLREDVAIAIAGFENRFIELETEVRNEIRQLQAEVQRTISELQNILVANNEYVFKYVQNRLDEFIDSFPKVITVYVYNPYRGEITDIQTAINDIYSVASIWGLTAAQYDSLQLTAIEYDNLQLTAQEYDTLGYKLLYKDPAHYMVSPFSGEYVPLQVVIMDLVHLHQDPGSLSADEYDDLEIDADTYDGDEITAFNYDWHGKEILA